MPRAVVLPSLVRAARRQDGEPTAEEDSAVVGGHPAEASLAVAEQQADGYLERLAKYVPVEILAPFLVVSSSTSIAKALLVALLIAFGVGAVIWALTRNLRLERPLQQPSWLVGAFSAVAYGAWALGTSGTVQSLVGASQQTATPILAAIAFLLPLVDDYLAARRSES